MALLDQISEKLQAGKAKEVVALVQQAIDEGVAAETILNDGLLAGMDIIGEKFKNNEIYVPEVLVAARAMSKGAALLKPLLQDAGSQAAGKVCIGTIEGDLHDIGKNLCVLMLKNYGFEVIDLGKDVPASVIVDAALENNAVAIGLSALMTTTMIKMKDVVDLAKEKGCTAKIAIGGACITDDYAKEIGADGYSEDAAGCVRLIKKLLEE